MKECPVGYILREAPHIYGIMDFLCLGENMSPLDFARMPRYFQQMLRVYQNEIARHRIAENKQREAQRHADIATRMVRNG